MFRTCTNQSCGSQHSAQQLLYCSTCSSPTQAVYGHGFYPPSHPDSHQLDHHYRQQAHTPISPEASRPVIAPQARKPLASLTHPGETWRGPPSDPMLWMTPPLSSKSITPGSHTATPFPTLSRPGSSKSKVFNYYDPKSEEKAKNQARRTCISCYNRSDKKCNLDVDSCENCQSKGIWCREPIKTPNLFDTASFEKFVYNYLSSRPATTRTEMPSVCLLSISWTSVEVGRALETQQSRCCLDTAGLFEYGDQPLIPSGLDLTTDIDKHAVHTADKVNRTTEEGYVDILQSCCRQLCSLLQALARPTKNTITYHIDHTPGLEVLASSILRQLYRKAVALWETFFEHLRWWASGFRKRTGFLRQKKAVATSLAQICKSIDTYSHAHREVQDVAFTMCNLALDHSLLTSQLKFLGRGMDKRSYDKELQDGLANMAVISVSTVDEDGAPALTAMLRLITHPITLYHFNQEIQALPRVYMSSLSPPPTDRQIWNLSYSPSAKRARILTSNMLCDCRPKRGYSNDRQISNKRSDSIGRRSARWRRKFIKIKLLLGAAQPPAHLEEKNFFDETLACQIGENQDSRSPGDMTLVEPELESILENQPPVASPFTRPISGLTDSAPGNGNSNPVDIMMKDLMPEQNIRSDTPTYTGDRKRKGFSFLPAAKKARTSEHAPFLNAKIDSNTSMLHYGPTESIGNASAHLKDTDKPRTTTRPTSWPRSRQFRRSAGLSVKKITDVFEKLRLQHDKPSPAAP
ncbi:hypothetical protein XPA_010233 [Xanthoria parietina]